MIPVFEPEILPEDIQAVQAALARGEISGSFGKALDEFEKEFASYCGCRHGVATTSGTTALELASAAAGFGPGDEVLVSACTNIASALGIVHRGAIPVPVDSEAKTWNLDLGLLEKLITPRTKGVVAVHLFGHPVDMDRLMEIARRHRLTVIEDGAEAHGAKVRGRVVGSFGQMSCYSFYANKIITTGEGGMVVTNDDALAEKLRLWRNLGFTQPRFRHEVAAYNFRMTSYQAALGHSQLRRIGPTLEKKRRIAGWYSQRLAGLPGIGLPVEEPWAWHVYWMYALTIGPETGTTRDALAARLRKEGVDTRTFFCPMNAQPCFQELPGFRPPPCPVADRLWQEGLYLPSSHFLKEADVDRVCSVFRGILSASKP
ncbi:MAG: DegT/DnrJ/EryC1/StrS family aminotransferase [Verrucomicrobia bacterium]|nr:DegT/DnrJ/EryC1/StrS family aminotransferase [Verrucomicrobiota bacterium]